MRSVNSLSALRGRVAVLLVVVLPLAGCADLLENPFAGNAPSFSEILDAGWIGSDDVSSGTPVADAPLYCYGTIGKEDCYVEPVPLAEGRLVGYRGPRPPSHDDL